MQKNSREIPINNNYLFDLSFGCYMANLHIQMGIENRFQTVLVQNILLKPQLLAIF